MLTNPNPGNSKLPIETEIKLMVFRSDVEPIFVVEGVKKYQIKQIYLDAARNWPDVILLCEQAGVDAVALKNLITLFPPHLPPKDIRLRKTTFDQKENFVVTVKGPKHGFGRVEIEFLITEDFFTQLLDANKIIGSLEKFRYKQEGFLFLTDSQHIPLTAEIDDVIEAGQMVVRNYPLLFVEFEFTDHKNISAAAQIEYFLSSNKNHSFSWLKRFTNVSNDKNYSMKNIARHGLVNSSEVNF